MEKEIRIVKWVNQPNILERNAKAEAYSRMCEEKRKENKVNIDMYSQNCTLCALAGALLLALATMIL
jgi:hypothetical protein